MDQASCGPITEPCWGLCCPELVPCAPLLAWKPMATLPSWLLCFGLSLGSICHKGQMPGGHLVGLFVSWQVCFLGKEIKALSSLPGFYGSNVHTAPQLPLKNKRANRDLDFFAGIVFSHPFPTPFLLFCPLIFCPLSLIVEEIGQASVAHFKNEMLGYIALQWEDPLCILK